MRTEPGAPLLRAGPVCASSGISSAAQPAGREAHKVLVWETHRSETLLSAHRDALRINVSFAAASPYGSQWLIAKISREQGPGEITTIDMH